MMEAESAKDPVRKSWDASDPFSYLNNNESQYIERQSTQEQLRVTQVDLGAKLGQLKIYETKYAHAKKEILRWKKKFDFVFRENELLSAENANIEASHKQIAYLQQEITFKEEECHALRELVTALEHAHKKARTALKHKNGSKSKSKLIVKKSGTESDNSKGTNKSNAEDMHSDSSDAMDNNEKESLISNGPEVSEEVDRKDSELSSLKSENAYLLSSLDQKMVQFQLKADQVNVQKNRIESLQVAQSEQQESFMQTLEQKQEEIAMLTAKLQNYESNSKVRKTLKSKESTSSEKSEKTTESLNEDADANITPPGTPPPLTERDFQSYLSHFPGGDDAPVDQIIQDWTPVTEVNPQSTSDVREEADIFFQSIPYESQAGARRILEPVLRQDMDTSDTEMQVIIRNVSSNCQNKFEDAILPALKTNKMYRVSYYTMRRRAVLTDVRIVLEKRDSNLFHRSNEGSTLDESQFGKNHVFLGPSLEDPSHLVPHTQRTLGPSTQAIFVSKPSIPFERNTLDSLLESDEEKRESNLEVTNVLNDQDDVGSVESLLNPHSDSENGSKTSNVNTQSDSGWSSDKNMLFHVSKNLRGRTKQLMGSVVAKGKQVVATAKMIQANANYGKYVHENSCCHYCRSCPIIGARYECTVCVGIEICGTCYGLGAHGLDNADELFYRVIELVVLRCSRLDRERTFLELLRFEICRNDLRKFQFSCNWIAGILNGKTSKELQARALEIPNIQRDTRKMFVPLLMRLVSDREDLEMKTEWELENDNAASVKSIRGNGSVCEGDGRFLETLRIWIADQYCTTNPFVERSISKYREQYDHSTFKSLPDPGSPRETTHTVQDNLEFSIEPSVTVDTIPSAYPSVKVHDISSNLLVEDPDSEERNTTLGAASTRTIVRKQSLKF
ncbi:unnamed protein product [Albugo candida]|uniref:ZZ-type domain-containing protein n=1 Tax=Albugo candida TaxID=65357 RepID=A0A024GFU3_9STRA|nr:unnamed protein product [Albugo candida]|eukprot:CCI45746.1 unnamed protein product [Albugo candida]